MSETLHIGEATFEIEGAELFGNYRETFLNGASNVLPVTLRQLTPELQTGTHKIAIVPELPPLTNNTRNLAGFRPGAYEVVDQMLNGENPPPGTHIQISQRVCLESVRFTGTGEVIQALGHISHELHEEAEIRRRILEALPHGEPNVVWMDPNDPGYAKLPDEILYNERSAADLAALGASYVRTPNGYQVKG